MFCSECGKEAAGKFCWNCGAPLQLGGGAQAGPAAASAPSAAADWQNEVNYETLIRNPEVRDLLAKQNPPEAHMTGEEFLESGSKLMGVSVSLDRVGKIAQEVYGRLGVGTGKTRSERYNRPVGRVIVAVLCTLARSGFNLQQVRQASDGCMLTCEIPSDMFSFAGQLLVTIERTPDGACVHADTHIKGQLFDWGKSNRCLHQLFDGIALS